MNRNYYLFERQVRELKPFLLGKSIAKIFTWRKDELIFELDDEDQTQFVKAGISIHLPYFLLTTAEKIKKDKFEVFKSVFNQAICDLSIKPYDKLIKIELETFELVIQF